MPPTYRHRGEVGGPGRFAGYGKLERTNQRLWEIKPSHNRQTCRATFPKPANPPTRGRSDTLSRHGRHAPLPQHLVNNPHVKGASSQSTAVRSINLTVKREAGLVSIREDNFFEGELHFEDGLPRTTKSDRSNHGFGMRSIRRCAEEYGGELRVRAEGGVFSLTMLFPCE